MAEAARWYETQRAGLGVAFVEAIDGAVVRVSENPGVGSPVPGVADDDICPRT